MYNYESRTNNFDLTQKFSVFVVPTGIGAAVGGYAGDASLAAREISKKNTFDC